MRPDIVSMMNARVAEVKAGFQTVEQCNWFIFDSKMKHEAVRYEDGGKPKVAYFHGPWVANEDWATYEPEVHNMIPLKNRSAWVLVAIEIAFFLILFRSLWRYSVGLLIKKK